MKYRHKMKLHEVAKVKGQKRRVADCLKKPGMCCSAILKTGCEIGGIDSFW